MSSKDLKKLIDLAKTVRRGGSSREQAMARLISAGIITENGRHKKHYPELSSFANSAEK